MSGAQRRHLRRCESKKPFNSLSQANVYIERVEKDGYTLDMRGDRRPLRAYLCKVCFKIHVGHIPLNEWRALQKQKYTVTKGD